jgi:hypothetical protein
MARALGQFLDVEVSVLGELPHRLCGVRDERGFGAEEPSIPGESYANRPTDGTSRTLDVRVDFLRFLNF